MCAVAETETSNQVSRQGDGDFLVNFRRDGGIVADSRDIEGGVLLHREDGDGALVGLHVSGTGRNPPGDGDIRLGLTGRHNAEFTGLTFLYAGKVDAAGLVGLGKTDGPGDDGIVVCDDEPERILITDTPSTLRQSGENEIGKFDGETFVAVGLVIVNGFDGEGDGFFHLRNRQNPRIITGPRDSVIRFRCGTPGTVRNGDGCVRTRRQRAVDADLDVYGVAVTVQLCDGEVVRRCEFDSVAMGTDADPVSFVIWVNAPSVRKVGLFVGENDGETLEEFLFAVPVNCDVVIAGSSAGLDFVDRRNTVITVIDVPRDRTVGRHMDKVNAEAGGWHHSEGERHIMLDA